VSRGEKEKPLKWRGQKAEITNTINSLRKTENDKEKDHERCILNQQRWIG